MKKRKILALFTAFSLAATMFGTFPAYADGNTTTITGDGTAEKTGTMTITLKIKGTPTAPDAPTKSDVTKTSITLATVTGCEYSKDGTTWQESPVFSGLTPGTEYTFYQRLKETDDNNPSEKSAGAAISTLADTYDLVITLVIKDKAKFTTEPAAKENLIYSGTAVELITAGTVSGGTAMYSLDGTNYSENIPTADSAGTYTVYYYAKGDSDHKDGDVNTLPVSVGMQGTLTITLVVKQKYSVTFDVDGGTPAPDAQTVVEGEKATAPATDPTKEGYTFGGWYNGDTKFDFDTAITADTELKAKWIANLAVTYDGNGADSGTAPTDSQKYEPNANVTVLGNTGNLKKTGYTFNGWNTKADGTGTSYAAGGIFAITADTTLYAQWTINQYTITFNTDGGTTIAPITQDYNTAVTAPADPTKTGYTFAGWDKAIPTTMPAENVTVKATWTINQYTITFNTDGGSAIAPITQDYGTAVTAPADPTKTGYTFAGWDKAIPTTMPAENVTVKATWTINQYTITFNTDGGSAIAPITQDYNTTVTAPADPTKTGYTFAGWEPAIPATMPAENVTVKATWTINQYTITFVSFGKTVEEYELDYGTNVPVPATPSVEGLRFAGWRPSIPATMPAEDLVITALWSDDATRNNARPEETSGGSSAPTFSDVSGSDETKINQTTQKMWAQLNDDNSVTVGWDKISGASKYVLYYVKDGEEVQVTETAKTKITMKTAKNGFTYKFRLKYITSGQTLDAPTGYTANLKVYYKPAVKAAYKNGKITLSWNKVPDAEKYKVYKYADGKLKAVTETTKNAVRISVSRTGTYRYAVKAYVDGEWTTVKSTDIVSVKVR